MTSHSQIRFGTDGWRAIINQDFTPENVAKVIQAFCDVQKNNTGQKIYVGFDRRRNSESTAKLVAQVLAHNSFTVFLASQFCPTPCVSWMVKTNQALAGVMVTASHNPSNWNGIKFKESYGGAASPEYTDKIEAQIIENDGNDKKPSIGDFLTLEKSGKIKVFDPHADYVNHLKKFVNVDLIRQAGFKIVVDPLFGAGTDFIKEVLAMGVVQIHDAADPNFGGLNPEPIEKNLGALKNKILQTRSHIGLATDGDADRIGAMDENGTYVNSHQIFALLLKHNLGYRKLSGTIVKSVSTTQLIDKICKKYGVKLIETPIGFKYICAELLKHNALMGGEESGGISLREHVHERDGVLNGLLLLEMMAVNGQSLKNLIQDLFDEFGTFHFVREDYPLTAEKIAEVKKITAEKNVKDVGGISVTRYDTQDGTKICFADDSWLLMRASGTEPLLRVYTEATSSARVKELLTFAKTYLSL